MAKRWYPEKEIQDLIWSQRERLSQDIFPDCESKVHWFREFSLGDLRPDFVVVNHPNITILEIKITAECNSVTQLLKYRAALQDWCFDNNDELGLDLKVDTILAARYIDTDVVKINRCFFDEVQRLRKIVISEDDEISMEDLNCALPIPHSVDLMTMKKLLLEDKHGHV